MGKLSILIVIKHMVFMSDCKYKCDRYTDKDDNGQIDPSVLAMVGKYMYISVDGCEPPIFMTITRYI
jgi:hypothetical protein